MTTNEGTVTLDIREFMDYGLDVYGVDGTKIGTVDDFDHLAGYMFVRPNPFASRVLYVPFSAVTHIDPREVFVSGSSAEAHREYASPPPRDTFVDQRTDPITAEDDSLAITTEPSGYDGSSVVVDEARIGRLAHHIAPGFHVYSSEMKDIGAIQQYDRETWEMLVKHGVLSKKVFVVPVAVVDSVDREGRNVYLAVSATDLQRHPLIGARNPKRDEADVETEIMEP